MKIAILLAEKCIVFSKKMQRKNIQSFAASTAFFMILSFIPLLVMLSSLLPYTNVTEEDLVYAALDISPAFADDILETLIREAFQGSNAIFSVSAVVTIWAGALGMLALIRGLNVIYDVDERRNYFHLRLVAAVYTVIMTLMVLFMLMIMVFGNLVKSIIIKAYPSLENLITFLIHFKFLLIIGVAIIIFALIYTFVTSAKLKLFGQLPGAVFSAVVWYLFSWFFAIYVDNTNHYTVYGSLSTPVVMMFWLYTCIYIFLIGAFINRFLMGIKKDPAGGKTE